MSQLQKNTAVYGFKGFLPFSILKFCPCQQALPAIAALLGSNASTFTETFTHMARCFNTHVCRI